MEHTVLGTNAYKNNVLEFIIERCKLYGKVAKRDIINKFGDWYTVTNCCNILEFENMIYRNVPEEEGREIYYMVTGLEW